MQPQPEINSYNNSSSNSRSNTAQISNTTKLRPRVIKSKQPLINFRFYLDIRDHQLTKRIEKQIKVLGGKQEFFLDLNVVTHFITDKVELPINVANNQPKTPTTPQQNLLNENANKSTPTRVAQTRADAILSRVRLQSGTPTKSNCTTTTIVATTTTPPYTVWQTDYALRFFKKVQHELKSYLQPENQRAKTNQQRDKLLKTTTTTAAANSDTIQFKGGFIKIEAIKRSCRPYYQLFRRPDCEWPKISLSSEEGAFRFATTTTTAATTTTVRTVAMTRKSRSRSSQCVTPLPVQNLRKPANVAATPTASTTTTTPTTGQCRQIKDSTDKQCGVCEICKIEYDTLTIHLKTKDHEYFAKNAQNFLALDTLIKSTADVNKFLADEVKSVSHNLEELEVDEMNVLTHNIIDPLESNLDATLANHSPPLRERSKRSTKGKHSSEKFQQTRAKTTTTTTTLDLTPNKQNNTLSSTRRKTNAVKNLSSPVRPFPPPSSLYKVVETSQLEQTPKRGAAGRVNDNVTGSPSLIVKFKKVRQTELLRLNGEAENFMFPNKPQSQQQQQRRASSDLPTDIDRHSSSDRLRTSIYSSSSLDSSVVSDIVTTIQEETTQKRETSNDALKRNRNGTFARRKSFQKAPIQPVTTTKSNNRRRTTKQTVSLMADLSPPSAAAAIVAATAKITLPAATRKSSRTATAIVSAATTSSRLLMAAAEVVKKSGKTKRTNASQNQTTKRTETELETERETEKVEVKVKSEIDGNNRMRRCRLVEPTVAKVVKMEDGMGDKSSSNSENEDDKQMEIVEEEVEGEEEQIVDVKVTRRRRRRLYGIGQNEEIYTTTSKTATTATPTKSTRNISNVMDDDEDDDDDEEDEDDEAEDNDDIIADKDFKYKPTKPIRRPAGKRRCGKQKRRVRKLTKRRKIAETPIETNEDVKLESTKELPRKIKLAQFYDYQKSDRIQEQTYAFERVPQTDLWYRVFMRQDACEEQYFEYFGSTQYHKLPYELGPIPYTLTKVGENSCKLCQSEEKKTETVTDIKKELPETKTVNEATTSASQPTTLPTYTLKHKKLHLLQRYRQEQEALQKQKDIEQEEKRQLEELIALETENLTNGLQSDMERCERAGSTQSTTSSCASSNNTNGHNSSSQHRKRSAFRNKLLNKAAILSLELPPRKSPREHASTLALVSIIKQRQESKSNSDADDAPTTPIPTENHVVTPLPLNNVAVKEEVASSKTTSRSAAATPIEEMCFATEISENVKRMRRGRNKYDHSPPYVLNSSRRLARKKLIKTEEPEKVIEKAEEVKETTVQEVPVEKAKEEPPNLPKSPIHRIRRIFTPNKTITRKTSSLARTKTPILINNNCNTMLHSKGISLPPSVRKTGQKKGVLEFSVEESALSALNAALEPKVSAQQLANQIDQFLTDNCKDFDVDELPTFERNNKQLDKEVTPPATDYFSSDFDLCDLLQDSETPLLGDEEVQACSREKKPLNLFNTMSINKYFHKRKYMKSNRTGWPKVPRKKYSMRQQTIIQSQMVKTVPEVKLVTPPDSEEKVEIESILGNLDEVNEEPEVAEESVAENPDNLKAEETDGETFYDGAETLPEEDDAETLPDSVVEEEMEEDDLNRAGTPVVDKEIDEEDEKAVEADDEDEFNDALETEEIEECGQEEEHENRVEDTEETAEQKQAEMVVEEEDEEEIDLPKSRRNSNLGKALENCLSSLNEEEPCVEEDTNSMTATTSTPTKHMTRNLRRTPQLNGSLVSCNSPTERAGDNSDIFTVSSDGLDTDLDLSNPHPHSKHDESQPQSAVSTCNNRSKSHKYDISKYVKNPAANTCAAEAATAAAKSLAIAQFLKKEVRVTCRRIRAPFRRFRYRR